jgi:acyl-CoA thioesterase-2
VTATPPWPTTSIDDILTALEPEQTGPGRFRARNVRAGIDRTLGSQLLGLTVAVAERSQPGMTVQSLHAAFPRGGDASRPIDVRVETVQAGRSLATVQVSYRQDEREHCRALVMLTRDEPDFLRHSARPPDELPGPDACEPFDCGLVPWETRTDGGQDAWRGAAGRPAAIDVWTRCKEVSGDGALSRQLLAHAVEAFVVPVGTLSHPPRELLRRGGCGLSVVLSQTITFHEPFTLDGWLLLRAESVHAGRGRLHGRIQVFSDGGLVASVSADGLLRAAAPPQSLAGRGADE